MARVRLNLNYESLSNEKAVAHAMKAVVRQEVATPSDQVQPVNAQPMAVLDGEVPVAEAVAVAGEVVPMSHMEGAVRVVSESFSRRGTRGCSLSEIHAGICTSVINNDKRKRKSDVAWSEGSDAEEDGDTQANERTKSVSMSVGTQGAAGAAAAPTLLDTTTSTAAAMSVGSMVTASAKLFALTKRKRYECEHGRQRSLCKECGGSGICEHGRERSLCKECGGSSICEHGRRRNRCKECGGSGICEHGRRRSGCKECGGSGICEHGRRRDGCKKCHAKRDIAQIYAAAVKHEAKKAAWL